MNNNEMASDIAEEDVFQPTKEDFATEDNTQSSIPTLYVLDVVREERHFKAIQDMEANDGKILSNEASLDMVEIKTSDMGVWNAEPLPSEENINEPVTTDLNTKTAKGNRNLH